MDFRHLAVALLIASAAILCPTGRLLAEETLTLERVQRLALESQPLMEAQTAEIESRRERAIVAGQLPDPELQLAVNELPIDTADAWSFRRDSDTDVMVGLAQAYPRAAKRRLRRLREEARTAEAIQERRNLARVIQRDAGLAFLEVWLAHREAELTQSQLTQAILQQDAEQIRFRTGKGAQAELLATTVESALLRDTVAEYRQMLAHRRLELSRWIGDAAQEAVPSALSMPAALSRDQLLARLPEHPSLLARAYLEDSARAGLDLARQEYKPDFRVELGYGYRPEFSEMLTLRVSLGLPLFTRNRQDREAAAARHDLMRASADRADALRDLTAQASLRHHDARSFEERLASFRRDVVPAARSRVDSAEASYRGGSGSLAEVLQARRSLLEMEMLALTLQAGAVRNRIELEYFINAGDQQ